MAWLLLPFFTQPVRETQHTLALLLDVNLLNCVCEPASERLRYGERDREGWGIDYVC